MDTTFSTEFTSSHAKVSKVTSTNKAAAIWDYLEENRFGMTPVFLVFAACLGGFAAAVTIKYSLVMLSIVGLTTGIVEVLLIAVAPMRVIFWFVVLAMLVDLFVFIF